MYLVCAARPPDTPFRESHWAQINKTGSASPVFERTLNLLAEAMRIGFTANALGLRAAPRSSRHAIMLDILTTQTPRPGHDAGQLQVQYAIPTVRHNERSCCAFSRDRALKSERKPWPGSDPPLIRFAIPRLPGASVWQPRAFHRPPYSRCLKGQYGYPPSRQIPSSASVSLCTHDHNRTSTSQHAHSSECRRASPAPTSATPRSPSAPDFGPPGPSSRC
jgi:hypothetical protein